MWFYAVVGAIIIIGLTALLMGNKEKDEPGVRDMYQDRVEDKRRKMTIINDWGYVE